MKCLRQNCNVPAINMQPGLLGECFDNEFKEPAFLKACFLCMEWFPRSIYAGMSTKIT